MKIFLSEIKEIESEYRFSGADDPWLVQAVTELDERDEATPGLSPNAKTVQRDVDAEFTLHQVDGVVVMNGSVDSSLQLLCSRCASRFDQPVTPRFIALFSRDPAMAGIPAKRDANGHRRYVSKGTAKSTHDPADMDLDITYLTEDYIDVKAVVSEQVQLQVPFQPLCQEDCQGICVNCGADQNRGRCACARLVKESAFAALGKLKLGPH
ncbi:MAG: DUF177 domain-containing protein [Bdellovibrionales bacterium]|nr:DUF177 domain-containing protein [Bdellovibrionales bacterium]